MDRVEVDLNAVTLAPPVSMVMSSGLGPGATEMEDGKGKSDGTGWGNFFGTERNCFGEAGDSK
jgi:hypothetical protein